MTIWSPQSRCMSQPHSWENTFSSGQNPGLLHLSKVSPPPPTPRTGQCPGTHPTVPTSFLTLLIHSQQPTKPTAAPSMLKLKAPGPAVSSCLMHTLLRLTSLPSHSPGVPLPWLPVLILLLQILVPASHTQLVSSCILLGTPFCTGARSLEVLPEVVRGRQHHIELPEGQFVRYSYHIEVTSRQWPEQCCPCLSHRLLVRMMVEGKGFCVTNAASPCRTPEDHRSTWAESVPKT